MWLEASEAETLLSFLQGKVRLDAFLASRCLQNTKLLQWTSTLCWHVLKRCAGLGECRAAAFSAARRSKVIRSDFAEHPLRRVFSRCATKECKIRLPWLTIKYHIVSPSSARCSVLRRPADTTSALCIGLLLQNLDKGLEWGDMGRYGEI